MLAAVTIIGGCRAGTVCGEPVTAQPRLQTRSSLRSSTDPRLTQKGGPTWGAPAVAMATGADNASQEVERSFSPSPVFLFAGGKERCPSLQHWDQISDSHTRRYWIWVATVIWPKNRSRGCAARSNRMWTACWVAAVSWKFVMKWESQAGSSTTAPWSPRCSFYMRQEGNKVQRSWHVSGNVFFPGNNKDICVCQQVLLTV